MNNHLTLEYQLAHELTMRQLNDFFGQYGKVGLIADVGGKGYEERIALFGIKPDVYDLSYGFDICKTPLPKKYDLILCNNTFEHIIDPYQAAKNIVESLKPGGLLFLTTLWIYPFHAYDDVIDTYRYTDQSLKVLFKDLEEIKCWYEDEYHPSGAVRVTYIGRKNASPR